MPRREFLFHLTDTCHADEGNAIRRTNWNKKEKSRKTIFDCAAVMASFAWQVWTLARIHTKLNSSDDFRRRWYFHNFSLDIHWHEDVRCVHCSRDRLFSNHSFSIFLDEYNKNKLESASLRSFRDLLYYRSEWWFCNLAIQNEKFIRNECRSNFQHGAFGCIASRRRWPFFFFRRAWRA